MNHPTPRANQFKIAFWQDVPASIEPALVLIQNRGSTLSTVCVDDSQNDRNLNIFHIPIDRVPRHFTYCNDALLHSTLRAAFHQIQKHLIDNELPMMGPLAYARTGWLMVHKNFTCQAALMKNLEIETWMKQWIEESIQGLKETPPWLNT